MPVEHILRDLLSPREDLALAVLFGSAATGRLTADSDIDVGFRWTQGAEDCTALLAAAERALGRTLDVVDLDLAPPQLRFEIARSGIPIVERAPGSWSAFRARAFLDWWDFRPIARRIHAAHIAGLRDGTHGAG